MFSDMGSLVMGLFESGTFQELDLLYVHPYFTLLLTLRYSALRALILPKNCPILHTVYVTSTNFLIFFLICMVQPDSVFRGSTLFAGSLSSILC
jgi:hypothetical protein